MKLVKLAVVGWMVALVGCAHSRGGVSESEALKLDRKLVKEAVIYGPGTKDGSVVPEVSMPGLRVEMIEERREGNRLIERHREWILEGDVTILGIPKEGKH